MNIETRLLAKRAVINTVGPFCSLLCEGLMKVLDSLYKLHQSVGAFLRARRSGESYDK